MSFLNVQGGYGLMGAAHSGLVGCNGYERWRMHWKHPQSVDYISARDAANTQSVVSDITREDGNKTFLLRDFVTYGDVVRIKLPYKDSVTSSNQYIWLENHQVGSNGKLDFLQYSNITYYAYCRPQGAAGIYAYHQIGRDILEGTSAEVWDNYDRDNLRIIPAEGYYDFELLADTYNANCVSYEPKTYAYRRGAPNPLCGGQDQEFQLFPLETDNVLYLSRELEPWRKVIDNQNYDCLPFLGDTMDAFRTHTKINMGTNPSTNNVKTYHSNNQNSSNIISAMNSKKNVQTTYLTGLSIEMTPVQGTGNILVQVRWDDYNITNDTRWTGKIALKDTAILTTGNTITLAQNRTVAQPTRDPETGLFAGRTRWTCENGSYFRQDSASALVLTENSSLTFDDGSRYELSKGARVEIHAGCSMTVRPGANVCLKGIVEVDSGGVLTLYDTVGMGTLARLIVRPGGKLVVDGGTLTSACGDVMWQGIEVVGDRTKRQLSQWQGTVELRNGATIENALCGILTGLREDNVNFATTGGIIQAEDAVFKNNCRAVEINSYAGLSPAGTLTDNVCIFQNCTFTVNNNNLFAANDTNFTEHARLWDVRGVKFNGCTFSNQTAGTISSGCGIHAEDAGVRVTTACVGAMPFVDCKCSDNNPKYSSFIGFTTAIEVNTTGNPYAVEVNEAQFGNNGTGVRVNGCNFATVTNCMFNQDVWPAGRRNNYGLHLDGSSGYKVEKDTFMRTSYPSGPFAVDNSTGIYVNNSGISNNSLYRNSFEKLTKGIHVVGQNGMGPMGLCMTCNRFSQGGYDIYLAARSRVANEQGTNAKGADNTFSSTMYSSFYNQGLDTIIYRYGNYSPPASPYRVATSSKAVANGCASTLCGGTPRSLAQFQSDMDVASYYSAVRTLMSDTVLDLNELEQWHAAAQPIADPYSLTETRFMEGYAETFAENAEDAETANYSEFHALKLALRDNGGIVGANDYSPLQGGTATLNVKSIPSGVYVLRVTDADGKEYHRKIVRK